MGSRLATPLDVSLAPALGSGVVDLLTRTTLLEFLTDTRCVPARSSLETSRITPTAISVIYVLHTWFAS